MNKSSDAIGRQRSAQLDELVSGGPSDALSLPQPFPPTLRSLRLIREFWLLTPQERQRFWKLCSPWLKELYITPFIYPGKYDYDENPFTGASVLSQSLRVLEINESALYRDADTQRHADAMHRSISDLFPALEELHVRPRDGTFQGAFPKLRKLVVLLYFRSSRRESFVKRQNDYIHQTFRDVSAAMSSDIFPSLIDMLILFDYSSDESVMVEDVIPMAGTSGLDDICIAKGVFLTFKYALTGGEKW
jgi:hypothetical protein